MQTNQIIVVHRRLNEKKNRKSKMEHTHKHTYAHRAFGNPTDAICTPKFSKFIRFRRDMHKNVQKSLTR